jgi:hypothetical protein
MKLQFGMLFLAFTFGNIALANVELVEKCSEKDQKIFSQMLKAMREKVSEIDKDLIVATSATSPQVVLDGSTISQEKREKAEQVCLGFFPRGAKLQKLTKKEKWDDTVSCLSFISITAPESPQGANHF